jgi:hypothetical protein
MSDREVLAEALAKVAARLRWAHRLRELARGACILTALPLLAQGLALLGVPAAARTALAPLLVMVALAVLALLAWRLTRPVTLSQAAGAADARADLKDELKSALWFSRGPPHDARVERLLARAARSASALDRPRLFPIGVPRSALGALALGLCAGALAWFPPGSPAPAPPAARSISPAASVKTVAAGEQHGESTTAAAFAEPPARGEQSPAEAAAARPPEPIPPAAEADAREQPIDGRNTAAPTSLAQARQRRQTGVAARDPAAGKHGEGLQAALASRLSEPLAALAPRETKAAPEPDEDAAPQAAARVTERLERQTREERRKLEGTPAQGEVRLNRRLRAIRRDSAASNQVAQGEGEAAEAGAQTSVDGTATGPPDGKGRSGGTSGEHPQSSPNDSADTQPVLGEPTVPLAARLDKAHLEPDDDPQQEARRESFYAATQRRASQAAFETVAPVWHTRREAALPSSLTPPAYRDTVKRYFLSEHAREE